MNNGLFIVFDGPDGSGKTTLVRKISEFFSNSYITCEPSTLDTGKEVRRVLSSKDPNEQNKLYDLYIEDRKNHIKKEIIPELNNEKIIFCDRYYYSTLVYQHLQGVGIDKILNDNSHFNIPDLSIILTDTYENLQGRINNRASKNKEFLEENDFIFKSIDMYNSMHTILPDHNIKYVKTDFDNNVDNVLNIIIDFLKSRKNINMIDFSSLDSNLEKFDMLSGSKLGIMIASALNRNINYNKLNIVDLSKIRLLGDSFLNGFIAHMHYQANKCNIQFIGQPKVINAINKKIKERENN